MGNSLSYRTSDVINEMYIWRKENYQNAVNYLAQLCKCKPSIISCEELDPRMKPDYDPGYVFFGPRNIMLGEIRWDQEGICSGFLVYEDNIRRVESYITQKRLERARQKSVNRTKEQAESREFSFKKGFDELAYFVKRNIKDVARAAVFVAVIGASVLSIHNTLNPSYINDSYTSGYQAVSYETHRTNDNSGYWYDYSDIASSYDESMDFDSFVYGTYKNVGWNTESKIDCMESLFKQFHLQGITHYSSFKDYCDAKGACELEDGKLVINTRKFCNIMEEYMDALNTVSELQSKESSKGMGRM